MAGLQGEVRSFLRLQPKTRHELKGLRLSGHEKSAIVKADRDPTIFAALDYFADLTLQRYLGSPCESFSDQPDSIANLESALGHGNLLSFRLEPELDQAADGRCKCWLIRLFLSPRFDCSLKIFSHSNADQRCPTRRRPTARLFRIIPY
jgi:hypothetical protein